MMMLLKKINLFLCIQFCFIGCVHAKNYNIFITHQQENRTEEMFDAAYPTFETNYAVLHNLFFQNEHWHIYNYTAYQTNQFSHKMLTGDTSNLSLDDFSISLGYSIVYQLDATNRMGYEYLSSFPFDRGQWIRLFWLHLF